MYGIFTYMWVIFGVNVGKYSSTMVRISGTFTSQHHCHAKRTSSTSAASPGSAAAPQADCGAAPGSPGTGARRAPPKGHQWPWWCQVSHVLPCFKWQIDKWLIYSRGRCYKYVFNWWFTSVTNGIWRSSILTSTCLFVEPVFIPASGSRLSWLPCNQSCCSEGKPWAISAGTSVRRFPARLRSRRWRKEWSWGASVRRFKMRPGKG